MAQRKAWCRRAAGATLLTIALLATSCGDEPPDASRADAFEMPPDVQRRTPTAVRLADGPPAELAESEDPDWSPTYDVAALGTDEVVVTAYLRERPSVAYLASLTDGTWSTLDLPSIDGEIDPQLTTVGQDVIIVGAPCAGDLNPESDEYPECPDGYAGLAVWRLDHEDHTWSEVALVPEEDLDLRGSETGVEPDTRWWWRIVGVVEDAVAVAVDDSISRVVTVGMDGTVDIPHKWTFDDHHAQVTCITGSGALVGLGGDGDGMSGGGAYITDPGLTHVAVRRSNVEGWQVLDDVTYTGLQSVGCTEHGFVVIGETDVSQEVAEWRTVDLTGQMLDSQPLPAQAVLGQEADFTTANFINRHLFYVSEGADDLIAVRDFGNLEQLDQVLTSDNPDVNASPVLLPRRVVVLTGPGAPVLTQELPTDRPAWVEGAASLPDGRVVALLHGRTSWEAHDDTFDLLVAE